MTLRERYEFMRCTVYDMKANERRGGFCIECEETDINDLCEDYKGCDYEYDYCASCNTWVFLLHVY